MTTWPCVHILLTGQHPGKHLIAVPCKLKCDNEWQWVCMGLATDRWSSCMQRAWVQLQSVGPATEPGSSCRAWVQLQSVGPAAEPWVQLQSRGSSCRAWGPGRGVQLQRVWVTSRSMQRATSAVCVQLPGGYSYIYRAWQGLGQALRRRGNMQVTKHKLLQNFVFYRQLVVARNAWEERVDICAWGMCTRQHQ